MRPVAILGGTFDPIHFGHLRPALECLERLDLAELRLIPASVPPHRPQPQASPAQRLAMVAAAAAGQRGFVVDDRELRREGPSYSVLTLSELRAELGPERPLCMLVGLDAFLGLQSWHRSEELLTLAHVVVLHRPGCALPAAEEGFAMGLLRAAQEGTPGLVAAAPAGRVFHLAVTQLEISATQIRGLCRAGRSPRYLLPEAVLAYIDQNRIYRGEGG